MSLPLSDTIPGNRVGGWPNQCIVRLLWRLNEPRANLAVGVLEISIEVCILSHETDFAAIWD